jgi:hypothetical protein
MKKLIRKILKEEFFTNNTNVFEIPYTQIKKYFLLGEAKATAPIYSDDEDYINERINRNYDDSGYYTIGSLKFKIEPTGHWLQRLNRKMEPEYKNNEKIYDPEVSEGLDLLFKVIDKKLVELIRKTDFNKNPNPCYEIINYNSITPDGNRVPYSLIVSVFPKGKKTYNIKLITQIKGDILYSEKHNCTRIKLYENKKRMEKLFPSFFELTVV